MPLVSENTFKEAISLYFEPMARRVRLPLIRQGNRLYELQSPLLTLQIELENGHRGYGVGIGLYPTNNPSYYKTGAGTKRIELIGLWYFAKYDGAQLNVVDLTYKIGPFMAQAQYMQEMAEKLCVPHMLGQRSDFEQVNELFQTSKEEAQTHWEAAEARQAINFRRNVRKE